MTWNSIPTKKNTFQNKRPVQRRSSSLSSSSYHEDSTRVDRRSMLVSTGKSILTTTLPPLVTVLTSSSTTFLKPAMAQPTTASSTSSSSSSAVMLPSKNLQQRHNGRTLTVVNDPNTYQAIAYSPSRSSQPPPSKSPQYLSLPPLILVLHGAGKNDRPIMEDLGNPLGEHAGLIPSLIVSSAMGTSMKDDDIPTSSPLSSISAPSILLENFAVLAPYSFQQPSFYNDPRKKVLGFVNWAIANQGTEDVLPIQFDPNNIILFGFSDGATVAVELLTTGQFSAGVICSYGYSGQQLPSKALQRLQNIPMWVYHSQDDIIFDVSNSDRLVSQLQYVNGITTNSKNNDSNNGSFDNDSKLIRYARYRSDPENLPPRVRGHSMGITASKSTELYEWLLNDVHPTSSSLSNTATKGKL